MKMSILIAIVALMTWACSPVKEATKTSAALNQAKQDSTEYEVIIVDINFDQWYLLNYSKAKDRSIEYYQNKNYVAASKWDDYYRRGKFTGVIDSYINYQPQIDYGMEVNRKLFWYFKFVQEYYHIRLF